ncbi:MAG TPA: amidohydrolase family protein [Actinomycetes bacterium]|nr:amidohydrolase family protein [Actinomycetes bacterium]
MDASSGRAPTKTLHLRGVVLPEGEQRDLWVREGVVTTEPVAGAQTVVDGGWIMPGLVDAHCHVGLDANGAVPPDVQEEQARADLDVGTLLIRDAGSAADTRWIDERDDLPRIIRAGRHIARSRRYIRNYGVEVDPADLVAAVEEQAKRGDGWVKLVGDWIEREVGDLTPCWPREVLEAGIGRAHELGVRVTAHVFGEDALPDLLGAGIDCIEHGTGLTDATIAMMAERGTALVPTRIQIDNFPHYAAAGEDKFPRYSAHMRHLHAGVDATLRAAHEAGVPIYCGTDAGGVLPHGLAAEEITAMCGFGMSPAEALAAGSWAARAWLGLPARLDEGTPADLVVYDEDPRLDLTTLRRPRTIVLRGRVVAPTR